MTVRISASVTREVTAEYHEVDTEDEALRRFRVFYPDADVKEVRIDHNAPPRQSQRGVE